MEYSIRGMFNSAVQSTFDYSWPTIDFGATAAITIENPQEYYQPGDLIQLTLTLRNENLDQITQWEIGGRIPE